MELGYILE